MSNSTERSRKSRKVRSFFNLNVVKKPRAKRDIEVIKKVRKITSMPNIKFIAWDGEGMGEGKDHRYVLLMNSEGDVLQDINGLSTEQCFDFLLDVSKRYKGQKVVHACFASGYDVNMMLRDLSYNNARRLQRTGTLRWNKKYVLSYIPHKSFSMSRYPNGDVPFRKTSKFTDDKKLTPVQDASITLWDVFSFFQGSFLNALSTCFTKEECTEMKYDIIAEGKQRRSQFTAEELENGYIESYTTLEVQALEKLMHRLHFYCSDLGIRLKRWDGAGAVATGLLEKERIKQHYPQSIPPQVMEASQHAFGGGRAEIFKYGHIELPEDKSIFHVDLCSAYPSAMIELVSLASGKWLPLSDNFTFDNSMSIYKLKWNFSDYDLPFYPFFYRDSHFHISYPSHGYNWVYWPEVVAAMKWFDRSCFEIEEQWSFIPDNPDVRPYDFVKDLYTRRQQLKAEGNGLQMVYKLGYNSFYGKTVQRVGFNSSKGLAPKFFQLQYGGWTTSHCRAKMFDAMMQHPHSVIAIATDGFWSLDYHDLDIGTGLGQWEYEKLTGGTFVQSGVYWVTNPDKSVVHHSRGINKNELSEQLILDEWKKGENISVKVPSTRFVTLGTGVASEQRFKEKWRTWATELREICIYPEINSTKRESATKYKKVDPSIGLIPTKPFSIMGWGYGYRMNVLSQQHPLPWDKEAVDKKEKEEKKENEDREIQAEIEESGW